MWSHAVTWRSSFLCYFMVSLKGVITLIKLHVTIPSPPILKYQSCWVLLLFDMCIKCMLSTSDLFSFSCHCTIFNQNVILNAVLNLYVPFLGDIVFVKMWYSISVWFTISSFNFMCSEMIVYEWVHETMCVCEIVRSCSVYTYFPALSFGHWHGRWQPLSFFMWRKYL